MRLKLLQVERFRNLAPLLWKPERWNLLLGENGQGKSNLLESLHLLGVGRSFRTHLDREMIAEGQRDATVGARFCDGQGLEHKLQLLLEPGRKKVTYDGRPLQRASRLMGLLPCVYLSSLDVSLVLGPPAGRRRWLDRLVALLDPYYLHLLLGYTRAVEQRNRLLQQRSSDEGVYAALEATVAQLAIPLWRRREEQLERLAVAAAAAFARFFPERQLGLRLLGWARAVPPGEREEAYRRALKDGRKSDIIQGITRVGPHRDDLRLTLEGRDVRVFGSMGQQKAVAASLKLVSASRMAQELGSPPLVLLDDIYSELDQRFAGLVRSMIPAAAQVIETGVLGPLPPVIPEGATAWRVQGGEVRSWQP